MHNPKKPLEPGCQVRVEVDATIVHQADKDNPYWYIVRYVDGREEAVSVGRITRIAERPQAVFDQGSVTILSPHLSPAAAVDLFHWLRCNLPELQATADAAAPAEEAQESES